MIAKRVSQEVGASNIRAATRIARTSVTAAESAGRLSALERAKALGIDCQIEWLATLDGRTRHSHRVVDGERVMLERSLAMVAATQATQMRHIRRLLIAAVL